MAELQLDREKDSNFESHENAAISDSSLGHGANDKLDPHGFPLRPQPTDDPLGMQYLHEWKTAC